MCDVVTVLETHNKQPEDSLQQNRYVYLLSAVMTPRTAYPVCDFSYKRCCRNLMTKTHSQFARLCKARGNASTGSLPTQPLPAGYAACQPPEQAAPTPAEYGQPRASWEGGEESSCAQRSKDNETGFSYPASKILSW